MLRVNLAHDTISSFDEMLETYNIYPNKLNLNLSLYLTIFSSTSQSYLLLVSNLFSEQSINDFKSRTV